MLLLLLQYSLSALQILLCLNTKIIDDAMFSTAAFVAVPVPALARSQALQTWPV
jgi:hypothetical protein